MGLKFQNHIKINSYDQYDNINGYVVPIYHKNDNYFYKDEELKQVNLTVLSPGSKKGPHIHDIRTSILTCIKGNICVVAKIQNEYYEYFSGEDNEFRSIEIPAGTAAMILNVGDVDAFILNMPNPEWVPGLDEIHEANFSDYVFQRSEKSN